MKNSLKTHTNKGVFSPKELCNLGALLILFGTTCVNAANANNNNIPSEKEAPGLKAFMARVDSWTKQIYNHPDTIPEVTKLYALPTLGQDLSDREHFQTMLTRLAKKPIFSDFATKNLAKIKSLDGRLRLSSLLLKMHKYQQQPPFLKNDIKSSNLAELIDETTIDRAFKQSSVIAALLESQQKEIAKFMSRVDTWIEQVKNNPDTKDEIIQKYNWPPQGNLRSHYQKQLSNLIKTYDPYPYINTDFLRKNLNTMKHLDYLLGLDLD